MTCGGGKIINPVAFEIGYVKIRWYGILIGIAIILGLYLTIRESKKQGIDPDFFLDFFIYAIPVAIIGARIYYVIFRWQYYRNNIFRIIALREGGLAIHGAIIGGLIVLLVMVKKRKINFWKTVDILSPPLVLGQAIGRWGNFINQEAYGKIVSKEFIEKFPEFIQKQMYIEGAYRSPTFLYESILNFSIFLFLFWWRRTNYKDGDIFLIYIITYSIGRFFIENMRTDSLMLGNLQIARIISFLMIMSGIILFYWRHRKGKNNA
ncbi:MAG: prolipoprotein diacylglyceryl transferase [Bacillota bacterium]